MVRLWYEFVLLYLALPSALGAARMAFGVGVPVLPVLWAAAVPAAFLLRARYGWGTAAFFGVRNAGWLSLALRGAGAALALAALLWVVSPESLFELPRRNPRLWFFVMIGYPILSVYPQGVLYRGLFYARYAGLFRTERGAWWAGALAFAWTHAVFGNLWAVALTLVGALVFNRTYRRSGSLLVSDIEHAVYGQMVFTLGWGRFLYHGTVRLMETLAR